MTSLEASYWPAPAPARIANGIMFNISWFAIVITHSSVIAVAILVAHLLAHFRFVGNGRSEVLLVSLVAVFGAVVDQVLFRTGVFNMAGVAATAPLWLTCLWPLFATTLMHAFAGFQQRVLFAAFLGGVGGGLSYVAGVRLTAVEFGSPLWGPVTIALVWALTLPLLLKFAAMLNDNRPPSGDALQSWDPAERRALD